MHMFCPVWSIELPVWMSSTESHLGLLDSIVRSAERLCEGGLCCLRHRRNVSTLWLLYKIYNRIVHPMNEYLNHFVAARNTPVQLPLFLVSYIATNKILLISCYICRLPRKKLLLNTFHDFHTPKRASSLFSDKHKANKNIHVSKKSVAFMLFLLAIYTAIREIAMQITSESQYNACCQSITTKNLKQPILTNILEAFIVSR